jgi:hypothetical protein
MSRFAPARRAAGVVLAAGLGFGLATSYAQQRRAGDGPPVTKPAAVTRPVATATAAIATTATSPATEPVDPVILKIRDEGLNRSKIPQSLDYLCNVIGPRLTGSPNGLRASEWTRDTLASYGLAEAKLEPWGPFGRGWTLRRFSMQVVGPNAFPLIGYPRAWSPGFDEPFEADVVFLDAKTDAEMAKYKGTLKGKVVLVGPPRDPAAYFEPLAVRMDDDRLTKLAASRPGTAPADAADGPGAATGPSASGPAATTGPATPGTRRTRRPRSSTGPATRPAASSAATAPAGEGELLTDRSSPASGPASRPADASPASALAALRLADRLLTFAADEGAALVVTPSPKGDGGTYFVTSASLPNTPPTTAPFAGLVTALSPATRPRPWSADPPAYPAQVTLTVEHYNRLVRLIKQGRAPRVAVDLKVAFNPADAMTFNTVAEIPGTDPGGEVVMVGAHLDSWHAGTGATDNAVGSAVAMEAVRILRALDLKPRRTIRVALWTGEEEGLLGSTAYVRQHFGSIPDAPTRVRSAVARLLTGTPATTRTIAAPGVAATQAGRLADPSEPDGGAGSPATRPAAALTPADVVKGPEYERLSVYFNLDNGSGKVRGIYAQTNEAALPLFAKWLRPFHDLGAKTVTRMTTGSTDHIAFDRIGLPGFGFIQDPLEYFPRTHHSNMDTYERVQLDDAKQAATIMAAFAWEAANLPERFPRKPAEPATIRPASMTPAATQPAAGG